MWQAIFQVEGEAAVWLNDATTCWKHHLAGVYEINVDEGYPVLCAAHCCPGAALRLKDRDEWIARDPLIKGSRFPLVLRSIKKESANALCPACKYRLPRLDQPSNRPDPRVGGLTIVLSLRADCSMMDA